MIIYFSHLKNFAAFVIQNYILHFFEVLFGQLYDLDCKMNEACLKVHFGLSKSINFSIL